MRRIVREFKSLTFIIILLLSTLRLIPHWFLLNIHNKKEIIKHDIKRWLECKHLEKKYGVQSGFLYLMTFSPEYRNLYYYRIGSFRFFLKHLCKPINTLFINARNGIGAGLFLQHGFSTIIAVQSIGKDCWINQQVTIGYNGPYNCPTIGDNVTIRAGAKIVGKVVVGNNVIVGANAVVVKNVPENCTVVGVPAYIVKRNGIKIKENL